MNERDRLFLAHILEAIAAVGEFTAEGKGAFLVDRKTQSLAVLSE